MHTKAEYYFKKAYISGNVIEEYKYRYPIYCVQMLKKHSNLGLKVESTPVERTIFAIKRVKKQVRRIANANPEMNKFLTLTFSENVSSLQTANYEFKKFRERLEYHTGKKLKYIAVPEFQKRGAVHYHLLIDYPYVAWNKYVKVWGKGGVWITKVRKKNATGAYIAKYVTDSKWTDLRFYKQKAYFCSKGLKRAIVLVDNFLDKFYEQITMKLQKRFLYYSQYVGNVQMTIYHQVE